MQTVAQMASSIHHISNHAKLRTAARAVFGSLVTGITATGSVILSEILRPQVADAKQLHAAEQRISSALKNDVQLDLLPDAYLSLVAPVAKSMRFRTLDGSDISKPASRKLEYLDVVRDSSAKPRDRVAVGPDGVQPAAAAAATLQARNARKQERRSTSAPKRTSESRRTKRPRVATRSNARASAKNERIKFPSPPALNQLGYWMVQIETGDGRGNHLPLFADIFSTYDPGFQALGPNAWTMTFQRAVDRVLEHLGTSGVWLVDRGFDDIAWMNWLHLRVEQHVIRLKSNRLVHPGTKDSAAINVADLAASLRTPHTADVRFVDKSTHKERSREVEFGWAPIWIDGVDHAQYLIVVDTGRANRLLLVTDKRPENAAEAAAMIHAYFERWGSEEVTRVEKQVTGLEKVRVRSLCAIRRLGWLAMIAVGIQALATLTRPKLRQVTLSRAKEFIARVRFIFYRIWRVVQGDVRRALDRREPSLRWLC